MRPEAGSGTAGARSARTRRARALGWGSVPLLALLCALALRRGDASGDSAVAGSPPASTRPDEAPPANRRAERSEPPSAARVSVDLDRRSTPADAPIAESASPTEESALSTDESAVATDDGADLAACVRLATEEEIVRCLEGRLAGRDLETLTKVFRFSFAGLPPNVKWIFATRLLAECDPLEALHVMRVVDGDGGADGYSADQWSRCVLAVMDEDPEWRRAWVESITLRDLCGREWSGYATRLVGQLRTAGVSELAALHDAIALGGAGAATDDQLREAILYAAQARTDPAERRAFLERIAFTERSGERPSAAGIGAIQALQAPSWSDGNSGAACAVVLRMLADEQIAVNVALHVLAQFDAEPAEGMDAEAWAWLWAECRRVAGRSGHSVDGK